MAILSIDVRTVQRKTRSAIAAAAYRSASRIEDHRTAIVHDYRRRSGVLETFIVAPPAARWAVERAALWNAAEAAEKRCDARTAREYVLALPHELDAAGRRAVAEGFASLVVERYGIAADVALHAPSREGDQRNWHAHVLTTVRTVETAGLGAKTRELDMATTSGAHIEQLRRDWTELVNEALREAGHLDATVLDARPRQERGLAGEPTVHMGPQATAMERRARRDAEAAGEAYEPYTNVAQLNARILADRGCEDRTLPPEEAHEPDHTEVAVRALPREASAPVPEQTSSVHTVRERDVDTGRELPRVRVLPPAAPTGVEPRGNGRDHRLHQVRAASGGRKSGRLRRRPTALVALAAVEHPFAVPVLTGRTFMEEQKAWTADDSVLGLMAGKSLMEEQQQAITGKAHPPADAKAALNSTDPLAATPLDRERSVSEAAPVAASARPDGPWTPFLATPDQRRLMGSILDMTMTMARQPQLAAGIQPVLAVAWRALGDLASRFRPWLKAILARRHDPAAQAEISEVSSWRVPFKELRGQFEDEGLLPPSPGPRGPQKTKKGELGR